MLGRFFAGGAVLLCCATPAAAERNDRPVECVFRNTLKIKRPVLVDLVKGGFQPKGNEQELAHQTLGRAVAYCTNQYGWADKRRNAAVQLMSGRVLREDAAYQGKSIGLTNEMILGFTATLDPAMRQAYVGGQVGGVQHKAALDYLKTQGIAVDGLAEDALRRLVELMSEGIIGAIMEQEADASYAR